MSSPKILEPSVSKLDLKQATSRSCNSKPQNPNRKRIKHDRSCRKRAKSFSGCAPVNSKPVLPTKFLLGGNINDPLNLNSLQDEEINRAMNAITPKSSPLPTPPRRKMPIEVIVSPNTHDPLHLLDCENDKEYEEHLCSPIKKGKKKRLKKRRSTSTSVEEGVSDPCCNPEARTPEATTDSAKIPEDPKVFDSFNITAYSNLDNKHLNRKNLSFDLDIEKKEPPKRRSEENQPNLFKKMKNDMDKIVSPVVPQPGAWLKRSNSVKIVRPRQNKVTDDKIPTFKEDNKRFQYGNYNRYYGYRNPNHEADHRLKVFSEHLYLFENKDILDIGCNIGHITLSVARDFRARTVLGIDIDPKLIAIARKNVKHYVKTAEVSPTRIDGTPDKQSTSKSSSEFFPISLPILYGSIDVPGFHDSHQGRGFPKNVTFKQCNYVLEDESLLSLEQPQFDVILCLSITKWIHLNWGDNGLRIAFRRMYEQLRPGGRLILEAQHWAGYKSKKKLTETIYKHYNAIELFPEKFGEYLLSPAVGFAKSDFLEFSPHKSSGFRRPIQIFTKSTMFPSERVEVTPSNPSCSDSVHMKVLNTGKCEPHISSKNCVEHVYTNLIESTPHYCRDPEESPDISAGNSQRSDDDKCEFKLSANENCNEITLKYSCDN